MEHNFRDKKCEGYQLFTSYVIVEAEVMTVILDSFSLKRYAFGLQVHVRTASYTYTNTSNPTE